MALLPLLALSLLSSAAAHPPPDPVCAQLNLPQSYCTRYRSLTPEQRASEIAAFHDRIKTFAALMESTPRLALPAEDDSLEADGDCVNGCIDVVIEAGSGKGGGWSLWRAWVWAMAMIVVRAAAVAWTAVWRVVAVFCATCSAREVGVWEACSAVCR
ncbi:unnamed protein product [Ostreobium quekettii]|uniref:Uncharacterized protein n=1 Tax=Ostreobium quekettii TaxID=121088 RepID=A0A8S1IV21_9CHLO|nr:unnamed protein product [Ostreobium quekettii]|eukprot:evm.model.scf_127.2 EVM.evm.TU.scf_127.2   scf_127:34409-34879(+)